MKGESATIVNCILDAEDGRVSDDRVREDGVEGKERGSDDVEHTSVINVVDEDVLNTSYNVTPFKQANQGQYCKAASSPHRR